MRNDENDYRPRDNADIESDMAELRTEIISNRNSRYSVDTARRFPKSTLRYDGTNTVGVIHNIALAPCVHHWQYIHDHEDGTSRPIHGSPCFNCDAIFRKEGSKDES